MKANIRIGKLDTKYLHISDIDKIIGPHGESALDSLDALDQELDDYDEDNEY